MALALVYTLMTGWFRLFCFHRRPSFHSFGGGFRAFYFSYSTLTTVAYGDIIPVSSVVRMLSMTEAMAGML